MKKLIFGILLLCLTIGANSQDIFTLDAVVDQDISCYGNNDGYIQADAYPNGDYQYYAKFGKDTLVSTRGEFKHLKPGVYKIWAINSVGKKVVAPDLKVLSPRALNMGFEVYKYPTPDSPLGDLAVNIVGGTAELQPYLVSWYNESGRLLNPEDNFGYQIFGVPAGYYTVIIEDDRGCFKSKKYLFRRSLKKA